MPEGKDAVSHSARIDKCAGEIQTASNHPGGICVTTCPLRILGMVQAIHARLPIFLHIQS